MRSPAQPDMLGFEGSEGEGAVLISLRRGSLLIAAGVILACVLSTASPSSASGAGAPVVSAGADQTITVRDPAFLRATVSDDGLPGGLGDLRWSWSRVSGPAPVVFDQSRDLFGVARFTMPGSYTLRLTVNDGSLTAQDDVVINVVAAATTVLRVPQD